MWSLVGVSSDYVPLSTVWYQCQVCVRFSQKCWWMSFTIKPVYQAVLVNSSVTVVLNFKVKVSATYRCYSQYVLTHLECKEKKV